MTQAQKNFVKGALILAAAGLIVKVIGALYRIPLANVLGTEGSGYYGMAYPIYSALVVVSTVGLPTAISKLVAERVAQCDRAGAHYTFQVAWRVLLALGLALFAALFLFAGPIAGLMKSAPVMYSLMAISPALLFVSLMSAYRGYFQGLQYMVPTAATQMVEASGKLLVGLGAAYLLMKTTGRAELAAAGALLGIAVSEAVALLYIAIVYRRRKRRILGQIEDLDPRGASRRFKPIFKKLLAIAVPVTLGACVMPIVLSLDSVIVSRTLQSIGYAQKESASLMGLLTMNVTPLISMPAALSSALAMSLVPAISRAFAQNDRGTVAQQSGIGFQLALLIGLPAATGFALLAGPILQMLFGSLDASELETAAALLTVMSVGVLFLTLLQTMTGILQGVGKQMLPVVSLAVGAGIKVVLSIVLIRIPSVNIMGAAVGTLVCFGTAALMNTVFAVKYAGVSIRVVQHIVKPAAATAGMGLCACLVWRGLAGWSNTAGVLAAVLVGLVVYCVILLALRTLSRQEWELLPGGDKFVKLLKKLKIWK